MTPWDSYYEHDEQADRNHAFEVECSSCGALYTNLDGDCPRCGSASCSYDSGAASRWNRYLNSSGR
jgi:uncharacterized OB-fold protein